jgi:hypothetical protein
MLPDNKRAKVALNSGPWSLVLVDSSHHKKTQISELSIEKRHHLAMLFRVSRRFDLNQKAMPRILSFSWIIAAFASLGLAGCVYPTPYQPRGASGGFSDVMTAPDAAMVGFTGNGFASAERVVEMTTLRCADLTLQRGYRYFVVTGYRDLSTNSSFTMPGQTWTNVYGNVSSSGSFTGNAYSTITPPQTYQVYKPAVMVAIKMGNDDKVLLPFGIVAANGQRIGALDAAFMQQSIRQQWGIKAAH